MTLEPCWALPWTADGVVTRSFVIHASRGPVPGVAWYAAEPAASRTSLVLLGHGGSGHKASSRNVRLATRLVQDFKINVVALDGGYLGLSMCSRFGVPVAARLDGRLAVAVLGTFGVRDSGVLHPGLRSPARILEAAHRVSAPVLFHAERFDEVFTFDDQVALFDAFGTTNKSMLVSEGTHGTQRSEDELTWLEFLDSHLRTCL